MDSRLQGGIAKVLRAGWPQCFAAAHLLFLATMTWIIISAIDPWTKVGMSVVVMFVDFVAAPILLSSGGIYQNYVAIIAVIVVGTIQWAAIGWCVGWIVRKLSRVSNAEAGSADASVKKRIL
jgi:hypothetical protein